MTDRVTIAYAHPGNVAGAFADSLLHVLMADANREERRICTEGAGYLAIVGGPRIASARNHLVRMFLDHHTSEWLWMLDADMTFDPEVLEVLLATADAKERPVVGGLYFAGGRGYIIPMLYQLVDPKTNDGQPVRHIIDWPEGAVVQVDATGAGCLFMHRSVLTEMRETSGDHWFHESIYKGMEFGEDWTFCVKLGQLGHPIYIATAAKCGHVKTFELTEDLWRSGRVPLQYMGGKPKEREPEEPKLVPFVGGVSQPLNRQQRRALERKSS